MFDAPPPFSYKNVTRGEICRFPLNLMNSRPSLLLLLASLLGVSPAPAVIVSQVSSMPGGATWTTGTFFSDGLPAHAGGDYISPGTTAPPAIFRSPNNGANEVFPGDSLEMESGSLSS